MRGQYHRCPFFRIFTDKYRQIPTNMERLLYDILTNLEEKAAELGLSYVDEDFGQLEAIDEEGKDTYPLTYPAVLERHRRGGG